MEFIKKARKTAESDSAEVQRTAEDVHEDIKNNGGAAVRQLVSKFDGWDGEFILGATKKKQLILQAPENLKKDIQFSLERVQGFAQAQMESFKEVEKETQPGVILGQKSIHMDVMSPGGDSFMPVPLL